MPCKGLLRQNELQEVARKDKNTRIAAVHRNTLFFYRIQLRLSNTMALCWRFGGVQHTTYETTRRRPRHTATNKLTSKDNCQSQKAKTLIVTTASTHRVGFCPVATSYRICALVILFSLASKVTNTYTGR